MFLCVTVTKLARSVVISIVDNGMWHNVGSWSLFNHRFISVI